MPATPKRTLRFFATCGKWNYDLSDQIGHSPTPAAPGRETTRTTAVSVDASHPRDGAWAIARRETDGRPAASNPTEPNLCRHLVSADGKSPRPAIHDEDRPREKLRPGLALALGLSALLFVAAPAAAQSNTISYNDYCSAYPALCGATGVAAGGGLIPIGSRAPGRPVGYGQFCFEHGALCAGIPDAGAVIVTPATLKLFAEVNAGINATIAYCPDRPTLRATFKHTAAGFRQVDQSETDTWSIGPRCGDCEDYALTKMMALIAIGYPRSALRLAAATVKSPAGGAQDHLVLTIHTTKGDYILDSLTESVRSWRDYPYRWIEIEQPVDGTMKWMRVAR